VGAIVLLEPARWPETWVRRFCAGIPVSLVYLPHSLWIDIPADMIDETDRDEAMEESDL
jgi:hypothetical protein